MVRRLKTAVVQKQLWLGLVPLISLSGITCLLLGSQSFAAIPQQFPVTIAQQPDSDAAEQVFQDALQLFEQETVESLRQAIVKFEQAALLYRQAGDRRLEALSLLLLGRIYDDLGEKQKALEFYNHALPLFQAVGDRGREATTLNNMGLVYSDLGEKQTALEYYERALPLLQEIGDTGGEAATLNNMGLVYSDLGEKQKALDYYNQALLLSRAVGNRSGEATILNNIGGIYDDLGEKQKALDYYNQALPLSRAVGDRAGEATILTGIGAVYDALGEKQKALDYYNQALPLHRATGNRTGEVMTLNNIGLVYNSLGEKQKALDYYNQALPLARATGNRTGEAYILGGIGSIYSDLGDQQKALDYYNQALLLSRSVGDRAGEANLLTSIGAISSVLGEKQKALDYYNQALPLLRVTGDRAGEAFTLDRIGAVYSGWGEKQKALDYYNQALLLFRSTGDRAGEAQSINGIGLVYSDLGEKQKALDYFNQALALSRAVGDRAGEATTLNNIGLAYNFLGEKQKALDYYNQALLLFQATGDPRGEAVTLSSIGVVYFDLGEKQKALDYYNQALPLRQATGDRRGEAITLNNIARVYGDLGEMQKALDYYNQALQLFRAVGDKVGEEIILYNLAAFTRAQGNLTAALSHIKVAIDIIEKLRTQIATPELRASYFATVQDDYQLYIDILMQLHQQNPSQGYDALALHISERARARSLLEQLTEAGLDLNADLDPALKAEEQHLTQALNAAEQKRLDLLNSSASNAELAAAIAERDDLLNQIQNLKARIRSEDPAYANLKYPDPLTLDGIQTQILDDNTLLLEYALGEERSYLFLVGKTTLKTYTLPPKAEIEAAVEEYRQLLLSPNFTDLSQGQNLSQMLLGQIAGELQDQRLVIVGDGKLQLLPFAALPVPVSSASTALKSQTPSSPNPFSPLWEKGSRNPISKSLAQSWERDLGRGQNPESPSSPNPFSRPPSFPPNQGGKTEEARAVFWTEKGSQNNTSKSLAQSGERDLGRGPNPATVPLLANHEIITLPSATSLAVQREQWQKRQPAPRTLAVIADPVFKPNDPRLGENATDAIAGNLDQYESLVRNSCGDFDRLPYTAAEAEQILALVPDAQEFSATGFEANYATATNPNLSQYRIVHLATHGCIQDNPLLSNLALSFFNADGQRAETSLLKLQDIYNLELNADLVVLSACQTGTGKEVQGEGIVGLTRGFMYAGARRVVVSLWSVNDMATSELMANYYQKMLEEGLNAIAALRAAQLEMWQSQDWSSPYYWAAFTPQGEWR